jgi:phospholipid/cholesterol/gamma-HCH transport system permease protein
MVSISIIRNRPIITALICAGRIGSGIGAELGSMRVTEQIVLWRYLVPIHSNT